MASLGLSKAYLCTAIPKVLPQGLSIQGQLTSRASSLRVFFKVLMVQKGVPAHPYLDDLLTWPLSKAQTPKDITVTVDCLGECGFIING